MRPGTLVDDRFEIERHAGTGGMGAVYRALDRQTGHPIALKVLRHAGVDVMGRFAREARILGEIVHPGIVRYVAHGATTANEPYLAMEWLDGESLSERLARGGGLGVEESVRLVQLVASAVGALHQSGIIHRDLKPSNLLLVDGSLERVKILDFGIARLVEGDRSLTSSGALLGTAGYMAPEQARGDAQVDARADVYALGCILFKCLTGRPVFDANDPLAVLLRVVLEEAPRPGAFAPDVPGALDDLCARMLAKTPELRPSDGAAVTEALRTLGGVEPQHEEPASTRAPALTATERRILCLVLARVDPSGPAAPRTGSSSVEGDAVRDRALRAAVARHRGVIHFLADGSMLVALSEGPRPASTRRFSADHGGDAATDLAARAARCALALRALIPDAPVAIVSGQAVIARSPIGEVIDRGVELLAAALPASIRLDDVTAGLLEARFDVQDDAGRKVVRQERDVADRARTLLGKPTPCVGRERELTTLGAIFDECISESVARAVIVTGGAGAGKSRLGHEVLKRIRASGGRVEIWIGRGDPMSAGSPLAMLAQLVRRAARIEDGEPLVVRQMKLHTRVARYLGKDPANVEDLVRVTEFLGELAGVPFDDDPSLQLRAARQDAQLMGDQMRRAWQDWIRAECQAHPLVLLLEDLHWGDRATVSFVDAALRSAADRSWMVLALARPEVHDLFPKLWSEREVQEIRMSALTKKASEKLVREVLGPETADDVVARVIERAAGNAFYLEELIRAVSEGGGDGLPETVLAMVQARLDGLEAQARLVLRAASVFGQVFWTPGVEALLGAEAASAAEWLAALADREVLSRRGAPRFPDADEFGFRHVLVREAAYAMLTEDDRALGHRLAGEWLERAGEPDAMVLAGHFERGEPARAVRWFLAAAEQALDGNDFEGSVARAEQGIRCGAEGETLGALLLVASEAHRWAGGAAEGERCGREAMRWLPRGSAPWYAAAGEVAFESGRLGRDDQLAGLAEELREAWPDDAGAQHVVGCGRLAIRLYLTGRYEAGDVLVSLIARAPVLERDPAARARVHATFATRALCTGDTVTYSNELMLTIAAYEELGDLRSVCNTRVNAGYALMQLGAWGDAEAVMREACATAEGMGLTVVVAAAKHNLGLVLARRGALGEAAKLESEAVSAFVRGKTRRAESAARAYLATILQLSGDPLGAEREARAAAELAAPASPLSAFTRAKLAEVLLARGAAQEARELAVGAAADLAALGSIEEGEVLVRLVHAEALNATGELEAAREALLHAERALLARADKIADPEVRARFLRDVPENARTLELAALSRRA